MSTSDAFAVGRPPASPTGPGPQFVVHVDRVGVNRRFRWIIAMHAVLAVVLVALLVVFASLIDLTGLSVLTLAPFAIILLGEIYQLGATCYLWGSRVVIREPVTFGPDGFTFQLAEGRLAAPWAALQSVTIRSVLGGRVAHLRLHPEVTAISPGIMTDLEPRLLSRVVRRGMTIGSVGVREDLEQIRQAAERLSGRPLPRA